MNIWRTEKEFVVVEETLCVGFKRNWNLEQQTVEVGKSTISAKVCGYWLDNVSKPFRSHYSVCCCLLFFRLIFIDSPLPHLLTHPPSPLPMIIYSLSSTLRSTLHLYYCLGLEAKAWWCTLRSVQMPVSSEWRQHLPPAVASHPVPSLKAPSFIIISLFLIHNLVDLQNLSKDSR